jgi:hypothetical protein
MSLPVGRSACSQGIVCVDSLRCHHTLPFPTSNDTMGLLDEIRFPPTRSSGRGRDMTTSMYENHVEARHLFTPAVLATKHWRQRAALPLLRFIAISTMATHQFSHSGFWDRARPARTAGRMQSLSSRRRRKGRPQDHPHPACVVPHSTRRFQVVLFLRLQSLHSITTSNIALICDQEWQLGTVECFALVTKDSHPRSSFTGGTQRAPGFLFLFSRARPPSSRLCSTL